jgi:glucose-1-phosphate cytidylyltransferase
MVTYGDGLADVDICKLLEFHRAHGKLATVTTTRPVSRFGMMEVDSSGLVNRFAEKPVVDGWANVGYFIFNRKVFDYFGGGDSCVMEREPMERLVADGQLMAYRHNGFFFAMDTYREYEILNKIWDSEKIPWKVW